MNATNSYITETYYPKKGGGGVLKKESLSCTVHMHKRD